MEWVNGVYLAIGVGLGMGGNWLLRSRLRSVASQQLATFQQLSQTIETLKQQLEQTRLAYHMASEIGQFKAGFLARISHELRSPLSSLIGAHQLILAGLCDNPAEEREFIAQAHESALKLMKLLDRIVTVAKTERGTAQLKIQPLQLARILQDVEELTYLQAKNYNLRLHIALPDPEIYILADPLCLKQILLNLIDSAIAPAAVGSISVSAHPFPNDGYVHIWIDSPRQGADWSEPVDLLRAVPMAQSAIDCNPHLSPGMNLAINLVLLEQMQGRLEVVAAQGAAEPNSTRLQCSLPLAILEPEFD